MAITWSRLHEVLGLGPRELAYADIQQAVAQQIMEDSQLDWKAERRTDESAKDELGKDVAAMANSGGGVIVFGVAEEGKGKRYALREIDLTEQAEQQIRSIIWGRVRPLVSGIEIVPLQRPDGPGRGALVLAVPASPDAPHFYEKNGQPPTAPWRNGPHTENLREHEIERAYRDRFFRRDAAASAVTALVAAGSGKLRFDDAEAARWCIVVAHPLASVPVGAPRITADQVREVVGQAGRRERELVRLGGFGPILEQLDLNPRVGLRRWVIRKRDSGEQDDGKAASLYAELHHDGTIFLAFPSSYTPEFNDARPVLNADYVERVVIAAVTLTRAWHRARSLDGATIMQATVANDPQDKRPYWVYGRQTYGFPNRAIPAWTNPVGEIEPVDALLDARPTTDNDRATAVDLAEGLLHQFGFGNLDTIAKPERAEET